ncbi:hypothetical protein GCM10009554_83270 [Kribbella koreensis]
MAAADGAASALGKAPAAGIAVQTPATKAVASNQWGTRFMGWASWGGSGPLIVKKVS